MMKTYTLFLALCTAMAAVLEKAQDDVGAIGLMQCALLLMILSELQGLSAAKGAL